MEPTSLLSDVPLVPATLAGTKRYHPLLAQLRGVKASGVYAIADRSGRVLYVGESHSGRLYDTITRHFRAWAIDPRNDPAGRRRGGTMYDRREVRVAYVVTDPSVAQAFQFAEIDRLTPRDNQVQGKSRDTIDDLPV
jgi:excinuclease UvrABC nuclease subunit